MNHFQIMKEVCNDIELSFNEEKYNKFMKYKDILKLWNNKMNLTAIVEAVSYTHLTLPTIA